MGDIMTDMHEKAMKNLRVIFDNLPYAILIITDTIVSGFPRIMSEILTDSESISSPIRMINRNQVRNTGKNAIKEIAGISSMIMEMGEKLQLQHEIREFTV